MTETVADPQGPLRAFVKRGDFFVGIDSDGCVFDTMEVKHKECFIPNIVRYYRLASVSRHLREVAEFINLYSNLRGINRFPGLVATIDMLAERADAVKRRPKLPALDGLRSWIARETKLANPALRAEASRTGDIDLALALEWSEAVNRSITDIVGEVPPFPFVRESLESLRGKADVMVVSATPGDALEREWSEHGLSPLVDQIAGQEMGSKKEHLILATAGRYAADHVLMVGDAPGDLAAARGAGALFFPIKPGFEDESWRDFFEEGLPRFLSGTFVGPYMQTQIAQFELLLPATPPWKSA